MLKQIDPDEFEMRAASTTMLPPCPFCGRHPISTTDQNETTELFVVKIICADCYVSMTCCHKTRDDARATVLARWSTRK